MSRRTHQHRSGQRTKPTSRVSQRHIEVEMDDNEIDVLEEIKLEEDRIRFQKELRSRIRQFVQIREKHSKEWKNWRKNCQDLGVKYSSIQNVDEEIFQLLQNANSVNDQSIEQYDNSNEQLTDLYKSIPKKEQSTPLKSRLEEERSNVTRIDAKRAQLNKQKSDLQKKSNQIESQLKNHSLVKSKRNELERQKEQLSTQLRSIRREVKTIDQDSKDATEKYNEKEILLSEESRREQIRYLKSMRDLLQEFTQILAIESPSPN